MGTSGKLRFTRLCYALQVTVKGWAVLFRALRFDNIEYLLYFLLQYEKDTHMVSIRESPSMTAPESRNTLTVQQTVSVEDGTAIVPFLYINEIYLEQLRSAARDLLNELETVTLNESIYTCSLEDFARNPDLLPFPIDWEGTVPSPFHLQRGCDQLGAI